MLLTPFKQIKLLTFTAGLLILVLAACNPTANQTAAPAQETAPDVAVEPAAEQPDAAEEAAKRNTSATEPAGVEHQTKAPAAEEEGDNLLLSAADSEPVEIERDPDVPELPFPDNADPSQCGIPQQWSSDEPAYLSGVYEDELIQPTVFLYDSHLRRKIQAQAPHGAEVKILLAQSNPTLDYFMVKVVDAELPNEGWVPAPFVTFEPPPPASEFEEATVPLGQAAAGG